MAIRKAGEFILLDYLGGGGFGEVYAASRNGRRVALKLIDPNLPPEVARHIREEAPRLRGLLSSSPSPHIVQLLDYGELHDQGQAKAYLEMELLEGQDLQKKIASEGTLPVHAALEITRQVTLGLQAAHCAGVVHRDIKPENIFLCQGETIQVKVLDFGIACDSNAAERQFAGTYPYMPPEAWNDGPGQNGNTGAADIYALGCVLYAMLLGRPPFLSDSVDIIQQMHQTLQPDYRPLEVDQPGMPDLVALLQQMLLKEPPERRPSAQAVQKEVDALLAVIPRELCLPPFYAAGLDREVTVRREDTSDPERTVLRIHAPAAEPKPAHVQPSRRFTVQQHLIPTRLDGQVCAAQVIGSQLIAGLADGRIVRLNLDTGGLEHLRQLPAPAANRADWEMIDTRAGLLLHNGGRTWYEIHHAGSTWREGSWPESGLKLAFDERWIYLAALRKIYRSPWDRRGDWETKDGLGRLLGAPLPIEGALYLPTSQGLQRLHRWESQAARIGEARAVHSMGAVGLYIAALYTWTDELQHQKIALHLLSTTGSEHPVAQTMIDGQPAWAAGSGPLEICDRRIFVACQDGRMACWSLQTEPLPPRLSLDWEMPVPAGFNLTTRPAAANGLVAVCGKNNDGTSCFLLREETGQPIPFENRIDGDIFLPPLWSGPRLCLLSHNGEIVVHQVNRLG